MAASRKTHRPEDLADTLGVSGKLVRAFLRKTFPRPASSKGSTWVLTDAQAKATIKHFKALNPSTARKATSKAKVASTRKSGVTVTHRRPTVKAGTRAKMTAGLPPTHDTPKDDTA